jgi:hypothetical protein
MDNRELKRQIEALKAEHAQDKARDLAARDAHWSGELGMVQAGLTDPASRAAVTAHWGSLPKAARGDTAHGWWEAQVAAHRGAAEGKEGVKPPELPQVLRGLLPEVKPLPRGPVPPGRPAPHLGQVAGPTGADPLAEARGKGLDAVMRAALRGR